MNAQIVFATTSQTQREGSMSKRNILGLSTLANPTYTKLNINLKDIETEIMREIESSAGGSVDSRDGRKTERSEKPRENIRSEEKRDDRRNDRQDDRREDRREDRRNDRQDDRREDRRNDRQDLSSLLESNYPKKSNKKTVQHEDLSQYQFEVDEEKERRSDLSAPSSDEDDSDDSDVDSDDDDDSSDSSRRTKKHKNRRDRDNRDRDNRDRDNRDQDRNRNDQDGESSYSERKNRRVNYHPLISGKSDKESNKHSEIVDRIFNEKDEDADEDDSKQIMIEKIDEMKDYLVELGYDISRVENVDMETPFELVKRVYKRCNRILHKRRYSSMFTQACMLGGTGLEALFDGDREFFGHYKWNMKGARNTIQIRLRQLEYEQSVIMASVIDRFGLGPTAVVLADLLPALLTLPYQNSKKAEAEQQKTLDKSEYANAIGELEQLRLSTAGKRYA